MSKQLDAAIESAAKKRAHAMSPPSPLEVADALAQRKAQAREIEAGAAEAERLARVNEDLRRDIERFEQRIRIFREIGKGRIERKQEVYEPRWGTVVTYEPLRSVWTGDQYADDAQQSLDELREALEANEQQIERLLAT